jgi:hypothetical protein
MTYTQVSFQNKLNDQPDIQDHRQQNTKVVAVHSHVQEGLQILKCHREPNSIHQSVQHLQRDTDNQNYLE